MVTTSHSPSSRLKQFAKELRLIFPNSQRLNRGNYVMSQLVQACRANDVTDLIIAHEHRGEPGTIIKLISQHMFTSVQPPISLLVTFLLLCLHYNLKPLFHSSQKPTCKLAAIAFKYCDWMKVLTTSLRVGFCDEWTMVTCGRILSTLDPMFNPFNWQCVLMHPTLLFYPLSGNLPHIIILF